MPKNSLQQSNSGQWTIPVEALILRIRRVLSENIPYRDIACNRSDNGYYVRIVSQDAQHNTRQGPYYFHDLLGLARMLNIFKSQHTFPVKMIDKRTGKTYTEGTLPPKLRFEVVTPVLLDAIRTIQAHYPDGYHVAPNGKAQKITATVTGALIEDQTRPVTQKQHGGGCIWFENKDQCNCGLWDDDIGEPVPGR